MREDPRRATRTALCGAILAVGAWASAACDSARKPASAQQASRPAATAENAAPSAPTTTAAPAAAPTTTRLPAPPRLVALGDVHGDFEATRAALRLAGAIDPQDRWIGKDLVVVQTGDQLDRGDGERKILELLERLQGEAREAGGALHVLNGNHELMNAAGDLRYVTAGGFLDFEREPGVDLADPRAARVPEPMRGRWLAFAPGGPWARKLAQRPVVLVIGETVFTHGGLLPQHVRRGLDTINDEVQRWLRGDGEISPELLQDDESPVWVRRYCLEPKPAECEVLRETLAAVPAKRLVVGHTVHKEGVMTACDGAVWCIDVGMAAYYGGHPEALEIVGDKVTVLREP
ncbi:metallophosphoesterase [Nannocystis bainbridge]|uniref:Metallophosphoesterase n=1 Tax=Nannocystis bainbridge TaxID=2995303 RepID=A0ABT5EAD6_9BACT|nr:metallophosphoesterase [Nannocystis bainbridge]MDC0722304.1 metallophosphoesterase [Nannocystis bainbridge]